MDEIKDDGIIEINNDEIENTNKLRKKAIFGLSGYLVINYVIGIVIQVVIIAIISAIYPNLQQEYASLLDQFNAIKETGTAEQITELETKLYSCMFYIKALSWINIFTSTIFFGYMVVLYFRELKKGFKLDGNWIGKNIAIGVVGFIILLITTLITNLICMMFTSSDNSINQMTIENMMKNGYLIPMFFLTVIFAPVAEELVFRKCFFDLINNKWIALIVSSLLFGLIHVIGGGDYIYLISYASSGLVLGGIYIFSKKDIYSSILVHMINNGFSYFMIVISMYLPQLLQ